MKQKNCLEIQTKWHHLQLYSEKLTYECESVCLQYKWISGTCSTCAAHVPAVWLLLAVFREDDTAGLTLLTAVPNTDTPEEEENEKDGAPLDANAAKHRAVHLLAEIKRDAWRSRGWLACLLQAPSLSLNEKSCGAANRWQTRSQQHSCRKQKLFFLLVRSCFCSPRIWCALRLTFWCAAAIFLLDAGQVSLVVTEDGVEGHTGGCHWHAGDPVTHRAV